MSTTTQQQPAPDFGEPWHEQEPPHPISVRAGVYWLNPRQFNRAVSCVNACAGMADPAAEIQAMREAIEAAHTALTDVENRGRDFDEGDCPYALTSYLQSIAHRALAKLQPFIKQ